MQGIISPDSNTTSTVDLSSLTDDILEDLCAIEIYKSIPTGFWANEDGSRADFSACVTEWKRRNPAFHSINEITAVICDRIMCKYVERNFPKVRRNETR